MHISDIFCGVPMYADDLSLIAATPSDLQSMLDIVYDYSNKWRYQFNTTKSVVMVSVGESQKSRLQARESRCWRKLKEVDTEKEKAPHPA